MSKENKLQKIIQSLYLFPYEKAKFDDKLNAANRKRLEEGKRKIKVTDILRVAFYEFMEKYENKEWDFDENIEAKEATENDNVICDLVVVSYDNGPSLSGFVAKVVKLIQTHTKLKHMLTPMGSIIEGSFKNVLALLDDIFTTFAPECERMGITFKLDWRKSKQNRIDGKVNSVMEKLCK